MGSEGFEDIDVTKWMVESTEQISRDRAGWRRCCDVRQGRLISTLDGIGVKKNIV